MNPRLRLWIFRGAYVFIGMIAIAIPLLPLEFSPDRLAMPDLFFVFTIAWVIRDQDSAPLILVALLGLLADVVLAHPVGLWAALIVLASELARMNDRLIRDGGLLVEMLFFALAIILSLVLQNILLLLTFSNTYALNRLMQIVMFSVLSYPFFAMFLHYIIRVRGQNSAGRPDRLGKVG